MESEVIRKRLEARFAAPLPEFYKRRIIFWHDEDQSFGEMIDELNIQEVKVLKLTGSNNFYAKQLLSEDDTISNYLVYNPISYNDIQDNWLLDIECYSEEFRADLLSMRMDEFGIPLKAVVLGIHLQIHQQKPTCYSHSHLFRLVLQIIRF